jgi:hypothetical protein
MWRRRNYWLPGTKVTVSTVLHGLQTGDSKWVTDDGGASFTVGPSMVSSVNMNAPLRSAAMARSSARFR